jgi:N6-L-threonylcarbamoyladenine synthase
MHIAAALYSSGREDLFDIPHLAYHVSGGTTEILHVCRSKNGFDCKILGKTLDISAGQLIDRVGVMLGLAFPAGAELEKLAMEAKPIKVKTCVKGCNVNFSGTENLCQKMMSDGISPQAIARYAIDTVKCTLLQSAKNAAALYPDETIVFAGGVTGNSIIRQALSDETNAVFADGGLSSDNAVGTAVLCARRYYSNDGEE